MTGLIGIAPVYCAKCGIVYNDIRMRLSPEQVELTMKDLEKCDPLTLTMFGYPCVACQRESVLGTFFAVGEYRFVQWVEKKVI